MNVFYSIGQFAAHLIVSTLVFIGVKTTTPAIPVPVAPPPPPAIITPLTTSDVVGIEQAKPQPLLQRPYLIQPIQNITINNPAPVQQKAMTDETTLNAPAATPVSIPVAVATPAETVPAYTIEIIYPVQQANQNTEHLARAVPLDGKNFIVIGAVLTDADGNNVRDQEMDIVASDDTQNATQNGASSFSKSINYPNGGYYYEYHYNFKTTGSHVITFTSNGVSKSVTILVNEQDTR